MQRRKTNIVAISRVILIKHRRRIIMKSSVNLS